MSGTETTQDTIATALREGLEPEHVSDLWSLAIRVARDQQRPEVQVFAELHRTALAPVVERLLAEQEKCIDVAVEQRDIIAAKCDEAERRLREIAALKPSIVESLTNDTLIDNPLAEPDEMPCECEDCGRLRIDALRSVLALLDTGAGQGKQRLPVLPDRFGPDRPENEP